MSLLATTKTIACRDAIKTLADRIFEGVGRKQRASDQYRKALAAMVADLLKGMSHTPIRPCFRPMGASCFSEKAVGYHAFTRALKDLERHEFVWRAAGEAAFQDKVGIVTRIVPTVRLSDFLAGHGITPLNRHTHFHIPKSFKSHEPLALKAGRTFNRKWKKIPGKPLLVNYSNPRAAKFAAQVTSINAFLAEQVFSFGDEPVLFRGFNQGDDQSSDYDKGGRLNCYGGGYQQLSKDERSAITINGLSTVEIDVSACHITIAHGKCSVALPNRADLYDIEDIPRNIVKSYVTLFLGLGKAPRAWTDEHRLDFDKEQLKWLGKEYPISKVGEKVIRHLPVLIAVQEKGLTWADFQFVESEIIVCTMCRLIEEQGICTLPVHDSLICASKDREIVTTYLSKVFFEKVRLNPVLK